MPLERLTAGVVTHNDAHQIAATLEALQAQDYPELDLLVVDNASTDGTPELIRERFPQVRLIGLTENNGPNPARNRILDEIPGEWAVLMDSDCVLRPDALSKLVAARDAHADGGCFTTRFVHPERPGIIQLEGAQFHYVGEASHYNVDRPAAEGFTEVTRVTLGPAGCLLLRRDAWEAAGRFDERFFFGREDGDFLFRLQLLGYRMYVVPGAVCLHKLKMRGLNAAFYQVRNYFYLVGGLYSRRALVVLLPALLVHQLAMAGFLIARGQGGTYLRAAASACRNLGTIAARRRLVRGIRRVSEREIINAEPLALRQDLVGDGLTAKAKRALDGFYRLYWRMARPLI